MQISRKRFEIEARYQLPTNRKWPTADRTMTSSMTSRDPETSKSWPSWMIAGLTVLLASAGAADGRWRCGARCYADATAESGRQTTLRYHVTLLRLGPPVLPRTHQVLALNSLMSTTQQYTHWLSRRNGQGASITFSHCKTVTTTLTMFSVHSSFSYEGDSTQWSRITKNKHWSSWRIMSCGNVYNCW